ncbi:MAG: endonuclease/exonuclease/phosphatase family protein [Marinilabiliaceae bacterium]
MSGLFQYGSRPLFLLLSIQLLIFPSTKVFAGSLSGNENREAAASEFYFEGTTSMAWNIPFPSDDQVSSDDSPKEEKELSMLTFNIYHDRDDWPARFPLMLEKIRELNPDVIALQEVIQKKDLENQAKMMADSLGYDHYFTSVDDESSDKRYGNAILSRYPIEERHGTKLKPYDDYRTAAHVRIEAGGEMIDVYNTHLHHLEENSDIRKEQISGLFDFIDETSGEGPVFLMGDFNANPGWEEISLLRDKFRDVYTVFHDDHLDSVHSTLNHRLGHEKRRIDHIYFNRAESHRIIPRKAEIVLDEEGENGVFPSDHFGVYAEFSIGEDAEENAYIPVFFENSLMEDSWSYSSAEYEGP